MKAVILAGGFARRMLPITENQPKSLLPIAGKPIINYIIGKMEHLPELDKIYVSINRKFEKDFILWTESLSTQKPVELVVEDCVREEEKPGAIGALVCTIKDRGIDDDLLVVNGDNLFDFSLKDFLGFFKEKSHTVNAFFDVETKERAKRFGVGALDAEGKIIEFVEKPDEPKSTFISAGIYLFPQKVVPMLSEYIKNGNNPDAPGFFMQWLYRRVPAFGFTFRGRWFDVGSFDLYEEANRYYSGSKP